MFHVGDEIIYGTQGVYRIEGIEEKTMGGTRRSYFSLKPVTENGVLIFAPTDNAQVLKKMRHLLTKDQIHQLIDSMPEEDSAWIAGDNDRKERYRKILAEGDHGELIRMIKALYTHKKEREAQGKRLHMMDEAFFRDAERALYNEFQYVLNLESKEALMTYILSRLEKR